MNKLEIPIAELIAVSLFAADCDVRYYLNGVAINKSHLVATNGHYMFAIPLPGAHDVTTIIPIGAIKQLIKSLTLKQRKNGIVYVTIQESKGTEKSKLEKDGVNVIFQPIDGIFPDWKSTIAEVATPVPHSSFNWKYMALFTRAAAILIDDKYAMPRLITNGIHAAQVDIKYLPQPIGVLMPLRD